jgi:hypothetical protein
MRPVSEICTVHLQPGAAKATWFVSWKLPIPRMGP